MKRKTKQVPPAKLKFFAKFVVATAEKTIGPFDDANEAALWAKRKWPWSSGGPVWWIVRLHESD